MPYEHQNTPQTSTPQATSRQAICMACAGGDHDQVLRHECCACPCHGTARLNDHVEVEA